MGKLFIEYMAKLLGDLFEIVEVNLYIYIFGGKFLALILELNNILYLNIKMSNLPCKNASVYFYKFVLIHHYYAWPKSEAILFH